MRGKCIECGNIDRFFEKELKEMHFCQACYYEHKPIDIHKALEGEE